MSLIDEHTSIFLPFENSVTENLGNGGLKFSVVGNPTIETCPPLIYPGFKKAMLCDGANQHLYLTNLNFYNDIIKGTNDFTIEWWMYSEIPELVNTEGYPTVGFILTTSVINPNWPNNSKHFVMYCQWSPGPDYYWYSWGISPNGNSQYTVGSILDDLKTQRNQWKHYAIVLKGNTYKIFHNGINNGINEFDVYESTSKVYSGNDIEMKIGTATNPYGHKYYLKNMRVSNYARYESDFNPYLEVCSQRLYYNLNVGD